MSYVLRKRHAFVTEFMKYCIFTGTVTPVTLIVMGVTDFNDRKNKFP